MDANALVILPIFAIAAALICFAALLLAGAWLPRRLGIEAEPPEIYRFLPPPAPLQQDKVTTPNRAEAKQRAEARRALMPAYEQAQAAYTAWAQIVDGLYAIEQHTEETATEARQQLSAWRTQNDHLKQELEDLLPTLPEKISRQKNGAAPRQGHGAA